MVKIVNPLGEVKKGKQGSAVYQGKYGEQIRRTLQPKKAVVSEAQQKHRQKYRDALNWRKSLSLANRRFLEGYCISNGIVDSYRITLAWHRFALRLYLEKVQFVFPGGYTIADGLNDGGNSNNAVETLRPNAPGDVTTIPLETPSGVAHWELVDDVTPDEDDTHIRCYNGAGYDLYNLPAPSGSGTINFIKVYLRCRYASPGTNFCEPKIKIGGIEYDAGEQALTANYAYYTYQWNQNPNSESAWTWDDIDSLQIGLRLRWSQPRCTQAYVEIDYTPVPPVVPRALYVRHSALLSVVQKRDGLIVKEYKDLSSLDDEYLTTQVGLGVVSGDGIEVITLPGLATKYRVP